MGVTHTELSAADLIANYWAAQAEIAELETALAEARVDTNAWFHVAMGAIGMALLAITVLLAVWFL